MITGHFALVGFLLFFTLALVAIASATIKIAKEYERGVVFPIPIELIRPLLAAGGQRAVRQWRTASRGDRVPR
jgi:hypothetical protein